MLLGGEGGEGGDNLDINTGLYKVPYPPLGGEERREEKDGEKERRGKKERRGQKREMDCHYDFGKLFQIGECFQNRWNNIHPCINM